ncbi:MAG: ribbon-helix-helix domain-containing protein [Candidatus Thorarchaeota archaeon]
MSLRAEESRLMKEKADLEAQISELKSSKKFSDKEISDRPESKRLKEINELLKKKIISVTMSQSLVSRIDDLVQERVGRSRAQLIEDSVRWYLDFTVHKWNERGVYVNSSRAVFESETLSSLFFSKLTPTDQYELGETAGSQSPIADVVRLFHGGDPSDEDSRSLVLNILQDNGWGLIEYEPAKGQISFHSPFYPLQFIRGYLESLLKVKLEIIETNVKENVAFRVQ